MDKSDRFIPLVYLVLFALILLLFISSGGRESLLD